MSLFAVLLQWSALGITFMAICVLAVTPLRSIPYSANEGLIVSSHALPTELSVFTWMQKTSLSSPGMGA